MYLQESGPPTWDLSPVSREWAGRWRRWQRHAGCESWNATAVSNGLLSLDDSVRCRRSGICMDAKACSLGGKHITWLELDMFCSNSSTTAQHRPLPPQRHRHECQGLQPWRQAAFGLQ